MGNKIANLLEELKWRGLVNQSTDENALNDAIQSKNIKVYIGFDPTAPSLHHGNLVQLILLKHFQDFGIQPFCVVGGSTGLIGDPRQSGERKLNEIETVHAWAENLKIQFQKFLDFDEKKPNHAIIVNNYDFTKDVTALEFLRDIGKHFRVGNMLSKETVSARLNSEEGISYTEFSYQILQAFDYLNLFQNYQVNLQCGGSDQWGNLTAGTDLIHKVTGQNVHALTTPIITKSDGSKFGKTEGGAIWLDPKMMSPYAFYQFWLNVDDLDVIKLLKVFTFLDHQEIERLEKEVQNNPGAREAQKVLAQEVTKFVHGEQSYLDAKNASEVLFGKADVKNLSNESFEQIASEIPTFKFSKGDKLSQLFLESKLASSFSDFKRTLQSKGYTLNNQVIEDENQVIGPEDLINDKYILLKKGKKLYALGQL